MKKASEHKSSIISDYLKELGSEKLEEMTKERNVNRLSLTTEWQFGYWLGRFIVSNYLPTLETDMLKTRKIIPVLPSEKEEHDRLEEYWFKHHDKNDYVTPDKGWIELTNYRHKLARKYLAPTLDCFVGVINVIDAEEFKKGVGVALWDSDLSNYNCDPDTIEIIIDPDGFADFIRLKLKVEEDLVWTSI